jgi:glycosyltransferase involved in cell wall biosynthesis
VEKITCGCATKLYPNSLGLKEIILKEGFCSPEKLEVLGSGSSNGIDTTYFDPSQYTSSHKKRLREKLEVPTTDIVFIFVGRLVAHKGINELVSSFTKLQKQFSNISLLLVGPFEQELNPIDEENFERIEKHAKIFSVGYQEDVRPYFAISNILAFPSYREGFPNVVMQAGAMNIPSIVTDINGCNEIIRDQDNGLVIPPKDEEALFQAMKYLLVHSEERRKMSLRSRGEITNYYDRKRFWEELLREYKKLESENPKPYLRPE